jgi:anti-sigma regulatory factor (Ser/Thr protein kinase)
LPGDTQEVMRQVKRIEAFLLDAGCGAPSARKMTLVAEEILTNILTDAWPGRDPGHCAVCVEATRDRDAVHVCLRTDDDGIAFDPTAARPPDLGASLEDRAVGGLGIFFVRTMTDAQTYQRIDGRNVFEVRKACALI